MAVISACANPASGGDPAATPVPTADPNAPIAITATVPANLAVSITETANLSATFNKAMDAATITAATFTLTQGITPVAGTVTYANLVATFNPTANLLRNTAYTATITTGVKDTLGVALITAKTWTFTTAKGPSPVVLGLAGNYVILAKTAISSSPTSVITGDIALSPNVASAITGFSLVADATNVFSKSSQITGKVYAADYAAPTPATLTTAVSDLQTAYTDAAGRLLPDFSELGAGNIGGLTLVPGLYKWTTGITLNTDITLNGGANDVWILQSTGSLYLASNVTIHLTGGAQAKNIVWQIDSAFLNAGAHFEGIALSAKAITLVSGASAHGRLLAQTAVTIDASTITQPAPDRKSVV